MRSGPGAAVAPQAAAARGAAGVGRSARLLRPTVVVSKSYRSISTPNRVGRAWQPPPKRPAVGYDERQSFPGGTGRTLARWSGRRTRRRSEKRGAAELSSSSVPWSGRRTRRRSEEPGAAELSRSSVRSSGRRTRAGRNGRPRGRVTKRPRPPSASATPCHSASSRSGWRPVPGRPAGARSRPRLHGPGLPAPESGAA